MRRGMWLWVQVEGGRIEGIGQEVSGWPRCVVRIGESVAGW